MGTTTLSIKNAQAAVQYVSPTDTSVSTGAWSKALLTLIGAPINNSNVANIQTWLAHEQDSSSWAKGAKGETAQQIQSNPLGVGGAGNHPGSIYEGLLLTAQTLLTNPSYGLIVGSLQSNNPGTWVTSSGGKLVDPNAATTAFASAVVNSPWQSGNTTTGSYSKNVASFLGLGQLEVNPTGLIGTYITGPIKGAYSDVASGTPAGVKELVSDAAGLIGDITNPTKLKNVGIFLLGGALATLGLVIFFKTTGPGEDATGVAKDAAKVAA